MVASDQPGGLPPELRVAVSSRGDGTMLDRTIDQRHVAHIVQQRRDFCHDAGISYDQAVYQTIQYGPGCTYDTVVEVTQPNNEGVTADVLYTEQSNVALFLPVADCVATVVYDPVRRALALAHLGRHSTIVNAMATLIDYFTRKGSRAANLVVWMAPSVKQQSYRMEYFDYANMELWQQFCIQKDSGYYLDLQGYNKECAIQKGVSPQNIAISPVNTAVNEHYFSHSQGDTAGRFAVVAMITS